MKSRFDYAIFYEDYDRRILYAADDPMKRQRRAKDKILRNFWGFLLLTLGFIFHSSAETFRNPRHIPIPSNPLQVGTADFNGDGRPDFYYADASGLNVILGNSDGSYAAPKTTAIGAATPPAGALSPATGSCQAADFNGDGFADAVCFPPIWATTPLPAIFIGNGDGTLRADSTLSIPNNFISEGLQFFFIAFADINSDGHLDIVFYNSTTGTLFTAFGNGSGQFENVVPSHLTFVDPSWVKGATVADINGDGHPDIVFIDDPMVMLGVGDGTFTEANNNLLVGADCHLADFDKDGRLDLFCARLATTQGTLLEYSLEIHHGNPDGTFTIAPFYSKSYTSADFVSPFAARDLNGDGYPDILALSADGLVVFFGRPGMHFTDPVHYAFYNFEGFDEDQGDPSLIADYNQDGNQDLAMPGGNGIYITYGRADGTFDAPPVIRSGQTTAYSVVADFNEDGTPDVFTSGVDGLQLLLGKGNGTFASPVTVQALPSSPATLESFAMLYLGDFNGDRHQDVIALHTASDGTFLPELLLGRGDGTFQDPLPVTNSNFLQIYSFQQIVVADINGDGRNDLVYLAADEGSGTGLVTVLVSKGDGTLEPLATALSASTYGNGGAADFNGDGKMDLVASEQQAMQVLLGHGDGSFDTTLPTLPVPSFNNQQYGCCGAVTTGDFDHDGNADFAFLMYAPGSTEGPTALVLYYGKGDGTFSQAVTAATLDRDYVHLIAADLSGDGLSDFVLSTTEGNGGNNDYRGTAISIVHSLPGRKFSAETNLVAGQGFVSMVAADFNRDGQQDLLFTNGNYADSLVLLTNVGTPTMSLTSSANPSTIGQAVTFTAAISAPADLTVLPSSGTITFTGLPAGDVSAPITFSGGGSGGPFKASATYETADLPVGSTLITAAFPGDSLLNAASASLTQVVNPPPAYQLVASPTTLEVKAGATANNSVTVTVKALYGFAGMVSLSCKVAYLGSGTENNPPTCRFGTSPLPVNGADVSTPLIVSTTAATAAHRKIASAGGFGKNGIVLWGGILLLLLPKRLRYRWLAVVVMILVVSGSMLSLSSCGGSGGSGGPTPPGGQPPPGSPGTQTGNYSITVSATSNTAVPAPPSLTVPLTVD